MKNTGFTLIECMVALFIIAIVLASSTRAIGLSIADVHDSYTRQVANWVADNQSNKFRLDAIYPDIGSTTQNLTMGGIDFIVMTQVISTPNPYFRRVDISVTDKDRPKQPIYKTTNFIAQF